MSAAVGIVIALAVALLLPGMVVRLIARSKAQLERCRRRGDLITARLRGFTRRGGPDGWQLQPAAGEPQDDVPRPARRLPETLAKGFGDLEQAMRQIAARSEPLADISTANAASIEQITVSVAHISDNNSDADAGLRPASLPPRQARSRAHRGKEPLHGDPRETDWVAPRLDKRSGDINGIVGAIREIADQTNLLALNAAIEARSWRRAGSQLCGGGRQECAKLAERTSSATLRSRTCSAGAPGDAARGRLHGADQRHRAEQVTADQDATRKIVPEIVPRSVPVIERMAEVACRSTNSADCHRVDGLEHGRHPRRVRKPTPHCGRTCDDGSAGADGTREPGALDGSRSSTWSPLARATPRKSHPAGKWRMVGSSASRRPACNSRGKMQRIFISYRAATQWAAGSAG